MTDRRPVFIVCGVLHREVEKIAAEEYPGSAVILLDSMLHMHPQRLREILDAEVARHGTEPIVLVYGDCHAYMNATGTGLHCARTRGINCCELLLGHDRYRELQRGNMFIFLPEWTERWHEVFADELGLSDQKEANKFMRDMRSGLVYLDTGLVPVPHETISEIEGHFEMPVSILSVSLDTLREKIRTAAERVCS